MIRLTDGTGTEITLAAPARRIVSLVPSQTELLHYLGLETQTVGITRFCIQPRSWHKTKERIGGTKDPDPEKIRMLHPDLILANKEENRKEHVESLRKDFPVFVTDVFDTASALRMIEEVGELTGTTNKAEELINRIRQADRVFLPDRPRKVLYLIWRNPWMAAGRGTYINHLLEKCGWTNAVETHRYPELTGEDIRRINPELVLLSTEPFPFKPVHFQEINRLLPSVPCHLADGDCFSWYGPGLLRFFPYAEKLIREIRSL